jgi:prostaglandin-endoperoxide synthase 2
MFNGIPGWLIRAVVKLANNWKWLGNKLNAYMINLSVNYCPHRPYPWSTVSDYVSWVSLSDMHWSARHLPAFYPTTPLPDLALVRKMFVRPTGAQRFCEKSTVLFPAFAQYLTDSFIRTRMPNTSAGDSQEVRRQNTSNHQLDLCPLYGLTQIQTDALRLKSASSGQRGRLKSQFINGQEYAQFLYQDDGKTIKPEFNDLEVPLGLDTYTDPALRARLFAFGGDRTNSSIQIAAMNTLFLREHNRLAAEIEARNGQWDDERVFQTARNILIPIFIKIVVEDYINHISPAPLRFRADPSVAWNAPWNKPNWITTEFSLLYRWHSLIPDTMTLNGKLYPIGTTFMDNRPLLDAGLTRAFVDLSAARAGCLGALNTAEDLLCIEMRAVKQGRTCNVAPYSKYREYVGLPRPQKFEDVSNNPDVVKILREAYGDPSNIEFYVGLFAESPVENSPLPPLILRMVAVDAFSQALTNPLLSERVFNQDTFTKFGWDTINGTSTLRELLERNNPGDLGDARISMTRADWNYKW